MTSLIYTPPPARVEIARMACRRPGAGAGRRGGFRGIGGGGGGDPYTPAADSILWWDPSQLSDGSVASWTDRIGGVAAAQGTGTKQPTRSATAIGSAYPGVTSDGGDVLVAAAGSVLSGRTQVTFTVGFLAPSETGASAKMLWEYTANGTTTQGGAAGYVDDTAVDRVCGAAKGGATGSAQRRCTDAASTFAVWSWVIDMTQTGAGMLVAIRKDGVAQALTNVVSTATVGSFANDSLYIFGRGTTPTIGIMATIGHFVVTPSAANPGTPTDAERYVAAQGGLVI